MADTLQSLYRKSNLRLARSIRLKIKAEALAMNAALLKKPDPNRPETWPYYLHLAGKYHESDTVMKVISIDTLKEIDFTYNNLLEHRATWDAYQIGTLNYFLLCEQYPHQIDLIKGILSPIDIDVAIAARDFQILDYDRNLVEPQEITLIEELQKRIDAVVETGYQERYNVTQELYCSGFYVVLINTIIRSIFNIRKSRTRTSEVHSFYLWSYLGSHGRLNRFKEYLTYSQAMWLYQNIDVVENNAGKTEIFNDLIENILTVRSIPLHGYDIWHNTENIPDQIYPDVEMAKLPLNHYAVSPFGITIDKVEDVLSKEVPLAPRNIDYYPDKLATIPEVIKIQESNRFNTKVLDSEMVDRTDALPVTYANAVLNHWIYWSATDKYLATINVVHPTSQELITMTSKESVILWLYCMYRMYEIDVIDIPTVLVTNVQRDQCPTFDELRGITEPRFVSPNSIYIALREYTYINKIISIQTFFEKLSSVHQNQLNHWYLFSSVDDMYTRGQLELMTLRFKKDHRCSLVSAPTSFLQFFKSKNWTVTNFSQKTYELLADEILKKATGESFRDKMSIDAMQQAMIAIMQQLNSYNIQFIRKVNVEPVKILNLPIVRFGNERSKGRMNAGLKVGIKIRTEDQFKAGIKEFLDITDIVDIQKFALRNRLKMKLSTDLDFHGVAKIKQHVQVKLARVVIDSSFIPGIERDMSSSDIDRIRTIDYYPDSVEVNGFKTDMGSVKVYPYRNED